MSASNGGNRDDNERGDLAAAEYVLSVLPESEQERLRALSQTSGEFAAEVAKWQARFAELTDDLEPVDPPAAVLRAIQSHIGGQVAGVKARNFAPKATLWDYLPFWRGLSIASLAAACIMAVMLLRPVDLQKNAADRKLVATLTLTNGSAAFVAAFDPGRKQMILVPASLLEEKKLVPELWLVPAGGKAISLGVLDPSRPQSMIMPDQLAALTKADASVVITLEPIGGAPGGVATGPVVARGTFSKI